jgi:hypothetical protein
VNLTPSVQMDSAKPKLLGLKSLRPSRLQDPLLYAPVKTTPIPIYY